MGGPARQWRIGSLASRVGVSETLLRAWEKRYGLLDPVRSTAGYRLYGPEDERRARAMLDARRSRIPAGQAAAEILARTRATAPEPAGPAAEDTTLGGPAESAAALADLRAAMAAYDVNEMHRVIDRLLGRVSVETAVRDVLLPFMHSVGSGWERGEVDVADEHFASDLVRTRLAALALGTGSATGPLALLSCLPDERHDIALKAFELVLLRAGWRTRFLGADTPMASLAFAVDVVRPDLLVLAGTDPRGFLLEAGPPAFSSVCPVALAGAGASEEAAAAWGAQHLRGDPVTAAQHLVAQGRARARDDRAREASPVEGHPSG